MNLSQHWNNRLLRRQLSHALILTGENRLKMATHLASAYVCEGTKPPCGDCIHCRKVKSGIHPDVIYIGGDGENLKVDEVRKLRGDAYIRPNEAERKVYVIENAHTMNQSGQNALLKLLEDGPDYAAFFFLLNNPELLLPTLRSRCETLRGENEQSEQEHDWEATELTNLICGAEDPMKLLAFCISLEKKKREELIFLLDRTIEKLTSRLLENPGRLLPKMDALREIRAACEFTVGVGHITGWMMAAFTE